MATTHHGFSLSFDIPVAFTADVFEAENPTLADCLTRLEPERRHRLLVVIDDGVMPGHPALLADLNRYVDTHADRLALAGAPMIVEGGEASKQGMGPAMDVVARINSAGIDRQSFVVVIGGGAVLDMASFAAAIAHRGVRVVRLPSTTLSQGDSGIAVKNGVNFFGKKNFVGTFVPPFAVVNDSRFLASLSPRDRRCAVSGNVTTDGTADSDGDTFTASVVTGPASGTLSFNADGTFTYTPATGFDGTVTFTYKQTDQFGGVSNTATATIVVLPNVDPAAVNDSASTFSGTPVTVTVLANDTDADAGQTLSVTGTSGGPANGGVVVNVDNTVTYTPNLGFAGTDTLR